jgi:NAD(P)-dependent dehydrogenase (short-subunit alcohol dehydrogenase family)
MGNGLDLQGVAMVTGGCGGLGRALCGHLSSVGMTAVAVDLPGLGADVEVDVTDAEAVRRAVEQVVGTHGRLDVVVANAGIGVGGVIEALPADAWKRALAVNVEGAINVLRASYPTMIEQRSGHLVFVASLAGLVPTPLLVPYAMTKHAIVGLSTSLRPEAARHGIGVTVVCPGPIDTGFLDTGGRAGVLEGIDGRRYLTRAAGRAVTPGTVAAATLRGIRHNRAVVAPGRAGLIWHAARFSPRLTERVIARTMRAELAPTG